MLNVVAPGQIVDNDETPTSLNQIFRSSGCPDRSKASPAAASKEASGESNGNRTVNIRHQCKKTIVLSCHRCLMEQHILDTNAEKQLS
jgi:hypothetical protein